MTAALDIIMQELAAAREKYPTFADSANQTVTVMTSELGEYATAVLRHDVVGPHGSIREAAQLGAVAIRAIEFWLATLPEVCPHCCNDRTVDGGHPCPTCGGPELHPNDPGTWRCGICGAVRPGSVQPVNDLECGDSCSEHYEEATK